MDAVRIDIRAYTASFRVPGMMGYQITSTASLPRQADAKSRRRKRGSHTDLNTMHWRKTSRRLLRFPKADHGGTGS
jgi:hypothetical protein